MKRSNQRNAFTMIELIFVIVILGILSAVALPKMIGTQNSAIAQKIESFVATMNRTTLPSMYVSALRDGGSIASMNLNNFIIIPNEITSLNISLCAATFTDIGDTSIGADIFCRDGDSINLPQFAFSIDGNTTLNSSYFR